MRVPSGDHTGLKSSLGSKCQPQISTSPVQQPDIAQVGSRITQRPPASRREIGPDWCTAWPPHKSLRRLPCRSNQVSCLGGTPPDRYVKMSPATEKTGTGLNEG